METSKIQSVKSALYEKAVEYILADPKVKRSFSKWERQHLAALTSCYSSYKVTLQTKNKARTISHLTAEIRLDFVRYVEQVLDIQPATKKEKTHYAEKFFGDLLRYLVANSEKQRLSVDSILEALKFIDPEVQEYLDLMISESMLPSIPHISDSKADNLPNAPISEKDISKKTDSNISVMPVRELMLSYFLSKLDSSAKPIPQLGQYFDTLVLMTHQNSSLHNAIINRTDEGTLKDVIKDIKDKLSGRVRDLVESSVETYNVVLEDLKKLPNEGGYVGEVAAVLGIDGNLVFLSEQIARELFPQRGSVYISNSHLSEIPSGYKFLPVIAERSSSHGLNDYRLQKYWNGVVEIIDLKYDLFDFELLINSIKEYRFSGCRHEVWFRLRDGALLSSYSQKKIYSGQAFSEKWRFFSPENAKNLEVHNNIALSNELSGHSSISMLPDIEITKMVSELIKANDTLPEHISNRQPYISDVRNSNLSSSAFIKSVVSTYSESDFLRPLIEKQISSYIQEFEPEVVALNDRRLLVESELHSATQELLTNKKRQDSLLKHLDSVVKPKIDNIKKDVVTALQDPVLTGLFGSISGQGESKPNSGIQGARPSYPKLLKASQERAKLLARLRLKFLEDSQIDAIVKHVRELAYKGYVFELIGEKSHEFAQLLLSICDYQEYFNIFSFFAENIEDCLNLINDISPVPMIINGIDEHQSRFYKTAFDSTKTVRELDSRLIITVTDVFTLANCKQVIPLNTNLIHKVQEKRDFDISDLSDICSDYGLSKLKFNSESESIIYDLLFYTLSELEH